MANCLRMPMASSLGCFSSSSVSSPKRRSFCAINSSKIPMPPLNPNDPFLSRLASLAAASRDTILNTPRNPDSLPYLDTFPQLMATPAEVERSSSRERRPRRPPPDLPSLLLDRRIVYIGMPLVPAVTELIIAELMYLRYDDPRAPIYLYINSTGTSRDDGEPIAMETAGFAIYDFLMQMKVEINTVCLAVAMGQACLLLAAGTKGKRYMFPYSKAMLQQPRVPPSGLMQASDVMIRAAEAKVQKDTLVRLIAKHTGNSEETVAKVMKRPFYMDAIKARDFGVIDKIVWSEKIQPGDGESPEYLDTARIDVKDAL